MDKNKKEKESGWLVLSQSVAANLGVNQIRRLGQWLAVPHT